jgi:hypothetical protein
MYNSTREFEACILVNGKPVTEVVHNGQTFLEGRKKSTYELYFRNNSSQQVLVVPSVDGLSIIDGQSAGKQSPGYVIDPWDSLTVPGWTVNGREAAEFIFHAQGAYWDDEQTYAEEMDEDSTNQGAIGFMVFRRKPRYTVRKSFMPDRDPTWKSRGDGRMRNHTLTGAGGSSISGAGGSVLNVDAVDAVNIMNVSSSVAGSVTSDASNATFTTTSAGTVGAQPHTVDGLGNNVTFDFMDVDEGKSLGTGFGEAVEFETRSVEFERELNPCATFAFYYDTIKNLRRMGVPVEHFNRHYSESISSAPNPFPDSPEVTGYATTPHGWMGKRGSTRRRKTRS